MLSVEGEYKMKDAQWWRDYRKRKAASVVQPMQPIATSVVQPMQLATIEHQVATLLNNVMQQQTQIDSLEESVSIQDKDRKSVV